MFDWDCIIGVRIRSYSSLDFPAFGLNTGRCAVSLRIQSECEKMPLRITPNTDTFHAVWILNKFLYLLLIMWSNTFSNVLGSGQYFEVVKGVIWCICKKLTLKTNKSTSKNRQHAPCGQLLNFSSAFIVSFVHPILG